MRAFSTGKLSGTIITKTAARTGMWAVIGKMKAVSLMIAAVSACILVPQLSHAQSKTGKSGLPLPRFVSLKSNKVNMRVGPGSDYKVEWLFIKKGLPVEIIQEYDNWRKVRGPDGAEGWVFHSLLSGKRTAIVTPWNSSNKERRISLLNSADSNASRSAVVEPGVLVEIESCDDSWCHVNTKGKNGAIIDGYVMQNQLWGVYPDESVDG